MADPKDRVLSVINSTTFNGIDFVEVVAPRTLHVHFLNKVAVADASLTAAITGGDSVPTVPLQAIANADWSTDPEGRPLLTLHVLTDGDFSFYTLTIVAPAVDRSSASARSHSKRPARAISTARHRRMSVHRTTRKCRRSITWRRISSASDRH